MRNPALVFFSFLLAAAALLTAGTAAAQEYQAGPVRTDSQIDVSAQKATRFTSVIVKLADPSLSALRGGAAAIDLSSAADRNYVAYLNGKIDEFETACEAVVPEAQAVHRYTVVFGGVSMLVPRDQVELVSTIPGVTAVFPDKLEQPTTERSPRFIGAPRLWRELGGRSDAGEGVIVGVLDSGVWPEHPSYSDPDPSGNPYPAPPVIPGSNGFGSGGPRSTCDFGNGAFNPSDAPFACNNKLIGAYNFTDTYKAIIGLLPEEYDSARDADGHGTHTSTTAAGNGRVASTVLDVDRGRVSGIAPRAHVIMYKNCHDEGCFGSDSVRAIEQAILDGVDVINYSISGGSSPYSDPVSIAFLDAYENGVFVAASAGNSGPTPDTTDHREPWTTTVGASTTDRHFLSTVTLFADNGDTLELSGASITAGIHASTPVVFPPAGEELCLNPFAPGTFAGEIVICERGVIARVAKSFNVAEGGAGGLLLYNPVLQGLATDSHFIPSVHLENDSGQALLDFMSTHTGVEGTFTDGTATEVQGDVMAAFSSRGGPGQTLGISKPDVTAPGVQILAGHTPTPAVVAGGLPGELFQVIQGTSMSGPHVAGAGALLTDFDSGWTPGEIKSALMTTARTRMVFKEDGVTPADPFDFGSGRINLRRAFDPGLLFVPATGLDFVTHQNDLWNVNYPSLYVPSHPGIIMVERTVRGVPSCHGPGNPNCKPRKTHWELDVRGGDDLIIDVPDKLKLPKNGDRTFKIMVDARNVPIGETRHATIRMRESHHRADFPITIVRRQAEVTLEKSCTPLVVPKGGTTDCTITATNTSFDDSAVYIEDKLPKNLKLVKGSVSGATVTGKTLSFLDILGGKSPPGINIAPGVSPAGYLPLALFGIAPVGGVGDETIVNFSGFGSFQFAGKSWTSIGMVSNGYAVVGGGSASDVSFLPQAFPDPTAPNNVLAPFWADLNPAAGGNLYAGTLTDGVNTWLILEWEDVPEFGGPNVYSFQIWIELDTGNEDISFTYGNLDAPLPLVNVGAEEELGISGANLGGPPAPGDELKVFSTPGPPGESHVITFSAKGKKKGEWQNCATMEGSLFQGISTACVEGEVTDDDPE